MLKREELLDKLININTMIMNGSASMNNVYQVAVDLINKEHYEDYILAIMDKESYDDLDLLIMKTMIEILQSIYNNSGILSPMSDDNYDRLYEIYISNANEDIIGAPVGEGEVVSHNFPKLRGTLNKVHFIYSSEKKGDKRKSLQDWIDQKENKLGRPLTDKEAKVEMFCKWDGCSGIFEFSPSFKLLRVLSRGYTKDNTAQNLTKYFPNYVPDFISDEPLNSEFGLKTEIVITQDKFNELIKKHPFKNKRNAVSGILNSNEPTKEMLDSLTVIPLQMEYLSKVFIPPIVYTDYPYEMASLKDLDDIKIKIERLKKQSEKIGADIDGIVFRMIDPTVQTLLGREDSINKFEVAYKLPPEEKKSTIKDIEFTIGTLGNISAVAKIEPIKMKGNTIKSISLGSIERAKSLRLRVGDEVKIKYDVIPYLFIDNTCKTSDNEIIEIPTYCPVCHEKLEPNPLLSCVNDNCPSRIIGRIVNYLNKLNIKNISEGIVTTLFNKGFLNSISDLYTLERYKTMLSELAGFGPASVQIIIDAINSARIMYDWQLFGALGCVGVSRKLFQKIFEVYDMNELIEIARGKEWEKLAEIPGIGRKTAIQIIKFIIDSEDLICSLAEHIQIKREPKKCYNTAVCFSKIRDKKFEEYLEENMVKVCDSLNKSVEVLVVPDKTETSSKIEKAKKQGIQVVTLEEAYKMFKYK